MGVVSTLIVGEASAVANGTHSKSVIERAIGLIVLQRRRIFHLTGGQIFRLCQSSSHSIRLSSVRFTALVVLCAAT